MKKLVLFGALALGMLSFTSYKTDTKAVETYNKCWGYANAGEIIWCGSVGCNFEIWDILFADCNGWEQIY